MSAVHHNTKHGHARIDTVGASPTYQSWRSMIARCRDARSPSFRFYGARGISVCDRWKDFATFLQDMGERPAGTTLDRIDNAKGYEPGNCRWSTQVEQQNNRSTNRRIEFQGRTQTLAEWARELGLPQGLLWHRLGSGWSVERALTEPRGAKPQRKARTHCKHGHALTPENVYTTPAGHPDCRACRQERVRKARAKE